MDSLETASTDVLVVGAGVVGLAIAAALARSGREVIIAETAETFGTGTSARNSEVVHAGLYYPKGSLKARFCIEGNHRLHDWCAQRGVRLAPVGKLIVATTADECNGLERLRQTAADSGVELIPQTTAQALAREPALSCAGALWSPRTSIIDSHGLMLSLLGDAEDHGAMLARNTPMVSATPTADGGLEVLCGGASPMRLRCRAVVNAAGLWARRVSLSIAGLPPQTVPPLSLAKGNYFSLSGRSPFTSLVYPLPVAGGLGVHYTVDLAGQGRFGPDVEWLDDLNAAHEVDPDQIDYRVSPQRGDAFYAAIRRYWPGLTDGALQPAYSGVRPKPHPARAASEDFILHGPAESGLSGYFALYGIESPGLTSSLALGDAMAERVIQEA